MTSHRSDLAVQVDDLRPDRDRPRAPWGLVLHTTGRGVVRRAREAGVPPEERALDYYVQAVASCHYLIAWDGTVYQISGDDRRVPHVGVSPEERRRYLRGEWTADVPRLALRQWRDRWPGRASPQHLFPSRSPNDCYIGAEMIPLEERRQGYHYTAAQHVAAATLAHDLGRRHGWPAGWHRSPRLVGHEDLDVARWASYGGWDPGAMRPRPWLSWEWILSTLDVLGAEK